MLSSRKALKGSRMARMKQVRERFKKNEITKVLNFYSTAQTSSLTVIDERGHMQRAGLQRRLCTMRVESDSNEGDESHVRAD